MCFTHPSLLLSAILKHILNICVVFFKFRVIMEFWHNETAHMARSRELPNCGYFLKPTVIDW